MKIDVIVLIVSNSDGTLSFCRPADNQLFLDGFLLVLMEARAELVLSNLLLIHFNGSSGSVPCLISR